MISFLLLYICSTNNVKLDKIKKFQKNSKMIIIIINYHNDLGNLKKLFISRMTKRTVPLNSSREI